jgi:hypothetical protein
VLIEARAIIFSAVEEMESVDQNPVPEKEVKTDKKEG